MRTLSSNETREVAAGMGVVEGIGPAPEAFTFTLAGSGEVLTGWMGWLTATVPNADAPLADPLADGDALGSGDGAQPTDGMEGLFWATCY